MPEDLQSDIEGLRAAYEERVRQLQLALERRDLHLSILSKVAARIHEEEELDNILGVALEEILEGLGLRAAWIFLGEAGDKRLHLAASRGVAESYLESVKRSGLGDCLCPEVFWTGHTMQARNTRDCPRMPGIVAGLERPVAHACVPLKLEGETRGVLNVAARPDEEFSADELEFLKTVGSQLCIAIERATHLRAERLRNQEARALAAINKAIGGSLDPAAVLQAVGSTALEILAADRVQIYLGSDPEHLRVGHLSGLPHPELKEGQDLDLDALAAKGQALALRERIPVHVNDWDQDPRVNKELAQRWEMASAIVEPLLARDLTLGLLVVTRAAARPWTPEQLDLAEALAAQAAVALESARLYEEARRAYQDLKAAQQRILQNEKMAVLGTFASGLAHEVRNPLNSITLQLSLLERRIARVGTDAAPIQDLVSVIREEIKRLDALVGDFLLFSRANRLQYLPASLEALTDDVVRLLRPESRAAGVTLRRQSRGEPIPSLLMDAERMKQVVINLVKNAVEAMPDGGAVTVETGIVDGMALVSVRDEGPGLPDDLDIFQLFVTSKPQGTGLGLSIAQQIVLEHGGEIVARNLDGKGAEFRVVLPVALVAAPADERTP